MFFSDKSNVFRASIGLEAEGNFSAMWSKALPILVN